jgi:hypothetical protein
MKYLIFKFKNILIAADEIIGSITKSIAKKTPAEIGIITKLYAKAHVKLILKFNFPLIT